MLEYDLTLELCIKCVVLYTKRVYRKLNVSPIFLFDLQTSERETSSTSTTCLPMRHQRNSQPPELDCHCFVGRCFGYGKSQPVAQSMDGISTDLYTVYMRSANEVKPVRCVKSDSARRVQSGASVHLSIRTNSTKPLQTPPPFAPNHHAKPRFQINLVIIATTRPTLLRRLRPYNIIHAQQ